MVCMAEHVSDNHSNYVLVNFVLSQQSFSDGVAANLVEPFEAFSMLCFETPLALTPRRKNIETKLKYRSHNKSLALVTTQHSKSVE